MTPVRTVIDSMHEHLRDMMTAILTVCLRKAIGSLLHANPIGAYNFPVLVNRVTTNGRTYGNIVSSDRVYQPWEDDLHFLSIWGKVKNNTMNDKIRGYRIYKAIETVKPLDGAIVEVGTYRGGMGCLMAKKARDEGIDSNIYLCDTFEGIVKSGHRDSYFTDGQLSGSSPEQVENLSKNLDVSPIILKGTFPEETADRIEEGEIRLGHIDVDVYESTKESYEWMWPRLCKGGVIVIDDYGWQLTDGVTDFVDEISGNESNYIFYLLNYQAIIIKMWD